MDIFINLYEYNISELGYEAEVAQLEYSIDTFHRGMTLTVNGLHHKLPILFKGLIDNIVSFTTSEENFQMIKVSECELIFLLSFSLLQISLYAFTGTITEKVLQLCS